MNKLLLAALLFTTATGTSAAEDPGSSHQVSGTATAVSDYVFRGLTQSWHGPAIQGSVDYAHSSGLFASAWASTVSEKVVAGAHSEIDLVLGYKLTVNDHWSYGAGVISVFYPGGNWNDMRWGERPDQTYDFTEANAFIGYRWLSMKYSYALTDLLGFNQKTGFSNSTKGSEYIEVNADIPVLETGFVLGLHAGHQDFKARAGDLDPDFNDYRVSLSKTFAGGWIGALQLTENKNAEFFNGTKSNLGENEMRNIGKRRFAVMLTKTF